MNRLPNLVEGKYAAGGGLPIGQEFPDLPQAAFLPPGNPCPVTAPFEPSGPTDGVARDVVGDRPQPGEEAFLMVSGEFGKVLKSLDQNLLHQILRVPFGFEFPRSRQFDLPKKRPVMGKEELLLCQAVGCSGTTNKFPRFVHSSFFTKFRAPPYGDWRLGRGRNFPPRRTKSSGKEPTMRSEQQAIRERLQAFRFDPPGARQTFAAKLARENGWSSKFTAEAIEEYRRFLLIAASCGHPVSPSDVVDQVWHLHLTYSRSYWQELCPHVLGIPFHHEPSRGTEEESAQLRTAYASTLASYREAFNESPPEAFWPAPGKPVDAARHIRVDRRFHWIIPKPVRWFPAASMGIAGTLLPLNLAAVAPWDLPGPQFLHWYLPILIATTMVAALLRIVLRGIDTGSRGDDLAPYEVACLIGGESRAAEAALASLAEQGIVSTESEKLWFGLVRNVRLKCVTPLLSEDRLERSMVQQLSNGISETKVLLAHGSREAKYLTDALSAKGLLETWDQFRMAALVPALLLSPVLAMGIVKLGVGLSRGKPVGFLILALVVASMLLAGMMIKPRRSRAGNRVAREFRQRFVELASIPVSRGPHSAKDMAMGVAIHGASCIQSPELADLKQQLIAHQQSCDGGWSGCGSGGDGGGGGGCGGGCGGGGCGGCGG